jgi:hypothetical protein
MASLASARSRVSGNGKRLCSTADDRWSALTAASMVSCTVSDLKMLATWNARPMPWRTISGGERPGEIDAVEQHLSLGGDRIDMLIARIEKPETIEAALGSRHRKPA